MLGVVALASRPRPPSRKEEVTLFRELRTPRLPVTHVPVGYCGQHRRSCHWEKCMTVTATASCRTRTIKLTCWGCLQHPHAGRNLLGGPSQVQRRVRRPSPGPWLLREATTLCCAPPPA